MLFELAQTAVAVTDIVTKRVVVPLVILFVGILAGRTIQNVIKKTADAVELDAHIKEAFSADLRLGELLSLFIGTIIYIFVIVWTLDTAGILVQTVQYLGILFGVLILVGFVAWFLDLIPNMIAGLRVRRTIKKGQTYKGSVPGKIEDIRLLRVIVRDKEQLYSVPHKTVLKQLRMS